MNFTRLFICCIMLIFVSCKKDPVIYTLTTSSNPPSGGQVIPESSDYEDGEIVRLQAIPNPKYSFENWSGTDGVGVPSVTMSSDKTVIANFIKKKYPLTITIEGEGTISEKIIQPGVTTDYYNSGTILELTAIPSKDWLFVEWKGDLTGNENPTKITIDNPKNIVAVFIDTKSNDIIEFSLLKENNPSLVEDLIFEINNDTIYKYVPYFFNAEKIIATFQHNGKYVKVNDTIQISNSSINNFNLSLDYSVEAVNGNIKSYVVILESFTKLPVILISTDNESEVTSKEEYLEGQLTFIGNNYKDPFYKKKIKIRGRGNHTWQQPKKPYQLKFDKKNSLLDMASDKKWIFLANYVDKTMARTAIAFEMGYLSNLNWTPKHDFIELFLNDTYKGTYQITEKVEEDDHRVNIGSDGYLIEVDQLDRMKSDDVYFKTNKLLFNIKSPEITINSSEYNYIKSFIQEVENRLHSDNFKNPQTGYKSLVDLDSFVDWYLINEISKNHDAAFYSSCFMTLIPGEKLKMGPLWDFDLAFGNHRLNDTETPQGFYIKNSTWIRKMFEDEEFVAKVKERFGYFYSKKQEIINYSNNLSNYIKKSRIENEKIWNTLGKYIFPNYKYDFNSFDEEHIYLNNWIDERFEWLKDAISKL